MHDDVTAVILAAGLGTRMKSRHAKVLHRAGGQTLIEHAVDTALAIARPERTFVVVGHQAGRVRDRAQARGVGFIEQTEQRGTGHAVMIGRDRLAGLAGLLVVYYGDCPLIPAQLLEQLVARQRQSWGAAATIVTTELTDPTGYGRIVRNAAGDLEAIVEQKAGTPEQLALHEINPGIYCFEADLFWKHVGQIVPNNPANEYYLTDIVQILIQAGYRVQALRAPDGRDLLGINNRIELAAADRVFRQRKVRQLMLDGVTVEKPETVTVDPKVQAGMDTIVEPFAQLLGATVIGENCVIGASSILSNAELADGVEVGPFTLIADSKIEAGAHVGPYARLRTGNVVGAGAHIGNFVELKKTRLGARSKASHLTYLGDSEVGERVNVGAGTITCNYDGTRKHQTRIGDGAFIGSNSTLVAPVLVEEGAYTAAGSVITDEVPKDALALGRAKQVNKQGWARKRREMDLK